MNTIPIVFAFDEKLIFPFDVCLCSLLMSAKQDTYYDIFIIHSRQVNLDHKELDIISSYYPNFHIQFIDIDDSFQSAYEIRGITQATYYRLLIPELIPNYNKVIYADADILFRMDLEEAYGIDINDYYLAATYDVGMNLNNDGIRYLQSNSSLKDSKYFQAGFCIFNIKKMREDGLVSRFKALAQKKFKFQDQDILNIACKNSILPLPPKYNMTTYSFEFATIHQEELASLYPTNDIEEACSCCNIHYNGNKPWQQYSLNFDIWWEVYRKSPIYNSKLYFDFYYDRLNILDQLTLWKRIKLLVRYFVYGIRKV